MRGCKIVDLPTTKNRYHQELKGPPSSNSYNSAPENKKNRFQSRDIPANLNVLRNLSLDVDYQSLINSNSLSAKIQKGTNVMGDFMSDSKIALSKIFNSFGSLGSRIIQSISVKPNLITILAGLGSVYTGICSVKNIFQTVSAYGDPKSNQVPWIIYAFQGLFEGCLSFCIAAPFFNIKNPFVQVINGKEVVPLKTIASLSFVPILGSGLINLMTNKSNLLYRIPIIKGPLKDTVSMMKSGLQKLITNTGEYDNSESSPQLPNLGG